MHLGNALFSYMYPLFWVLSFVGRVWMENWWGGQERDRKTTLANFTSKYDQVNAHYHLKLYQIALS